MKLILFLATCGVLATTVWCSPVPRGPQPHGLKAKRSTVSEQEAATAEYADLLSQLLHHNVQAQIEGLVNSGLSLEDAVTQVAIQRKRGRSKKRKGKGRKGRRRDDDDDDDDDDDSDSSDSDKMVKAQLLKMVGNLVGDLLGGGLAN